MLEGKSYKRFKNIKSARNYVDTKIWMIRQSSSLSLYGSHSQEYQPCLKSYTTISDKYKDKIWTLKHTTEAPCCPEEGMAFCMVEFEESEEVRLHYHPVGCCPYTDYHLKSWRAL